MIRHRFLLALALALPLFGCGSILKLPGGEPAAHYMLRPAPTRNVDSPLPVVIMIAEPDASAALDTNRVVLKPSDLELQYYAGARWIDRATRMLQTHLIAALSGTVKDVGTEAMTLAADYRVQTNLTSFEAVYEGNKSPTVHVVLEAKLFSRAPLALRERRTFGAEVAASSDKQAAIITAFDRATGEVTAEFVDWVLAGVQMKAESN